MAIYRLKMYENDSLVQMQCFDRTRDCLEKSEKLVGRWLQSQSRWVQLDVATRPSSEPAFYLVRQATDMQDWSKKLEQVRGGMN
jgi:hypothetical protein